MHSAKSQMMDRYTIGGVAPRLRLAVKAFNAAVSRENVAVRRGSTSGKRQKDRINIYRARSSAG